MKTYKGAHLIRRIRRQIEQTGRTAEVSLIPVPEWLNGSYDRATLIEIKIFKGSSAKILHHSVRMPVDEINIDRIVQRSMNNDGQTVAQIEEILSVFGPSLRKDEGYLMMERFSCNPALVVPVRMIDLIGREHDMSLYLPSSGRHPMPGDDRAKIMNEAHIECDTKRRDSNGRQRPVRIGALFAHYLRHHPAGASILEQVIPRLAETIDNADHRDGGSAVTVLQAKTGLPDKRLRWGIKDRTIHIVDHDHPKWAIEKDTILIKIALPQSMVTGLVGKRLSEVIDGLPFDSGLVITHAKLRRAPWSGVSLKIKGSAITPETLSDELTA